MNRAWTKGEWRIENVSDAVRVVVGAGRKKIILGRFAPKQLPEGETEANARLAAAAPDLAGALSDALKLAYEEGGPGMRRCLRCNVNICVREHLFGCVVGRAEDALKKAGAGTVRA